MRDSMSAIGGLQEEPDFSIMNSNFLTTEVIIAIFNKLHYNIKDISLL
jgi:hypothetical protein